MKKILIFFWVIIVFYFFWVNFLSANEQEKKLEIGYPEFGEVKPISVTTPLPDYFKYIFFAIIGISGLTAFGALIFAGFEYITSAGEAEKMKEGKDRIKSSFLGLVVIVLSFLIINTINPVFLDFKTSPVEIFVPELPPGIFVCPKSVEIVPVWNLIDEFNNIKNDTPDSRLRKLNIRNELNSKLQTITKECRGVGSPHPVNTADFKYLYGIPFKNSEEKYTQYGALLFDSPNFTGNIEMANPNNNTKPYEYQIKNNPLSIIPFKLSNNPDPLWKVALFEDRNFNVEHPEKRIDYYPLGGWNGPVFEAKNITAQPQSMKVSGPLIVVLHSSKNNSSKVFMGNERDLLEYKELYTRESCWKLFCKVSAVDGITIVAQE